MQDLHKRLLLVLTNLIALPSFCPAQLRELGIGTLDQSKPSIAGQTASHVLPELLTRGVALDTIRQTGTKTQGQTAVPIPAEKIGGET